MWAKTLAPPAEATPGCEPCVSEDRHACADSRLNPGHAVFDDGTPRRFAPMQRAA